MTKTNDLAISPDVLYGIAQLALEQLDGIRPIQPSARVGEILTGRRAKGIVIERDGAEVSVALTVAVDYGVEIPKIAKSAQRSVREAVASMTGLAVRSVDVNVEVVDLGEAAQAA